MIFQIRVNLGSLQVSVFKGIDLSGQCRKKSGKNKLSEKIKSFRGEKTGENKHDFFWHEEKLFKKFEIAEAFPSKKSHNAYYDANKIVYES